MVYYKMRESEPGGLPMGELQRATLLLIFTKRRKTDRLLNTMEIYTDELNGIIKHREQDGGQNNG